MNIVVGGSLRGDKHVNTLFTFFMMMTPIFYPLSFQFEINNHNERQKQGSLLEVYQISLFEGESIMIQNTNHNERTKLFLNQYVFQNKKEELFLYD